MEDIVYKISNKAKLLIYVNDLYNGHIDIDDIDTIISKLQDNNFSNKEVLLYFKDCYSKKNNPIELLNKIY